MKKKIVSAGEAISLIKSGDTLCNTGFVGAVTPEYLLATLEQRFLETGEPRDLTLIYSSGQGDLKDKGVNRIAREGLIRRVIAGHYGLVPKLGRLAMDNRIEAYNFPQGAITNNYLEIAARRPGVITKVGLGTFADPRQEGGKVNARTTEDLVELVELNGEEWLHYKPFHIDVAFLRGTTADAHGNLTMEKEALSMENLALAMATKACGGHVIAQVERVAEVGTLHPKAVKVPGVMVDLVVVAPPELHWQTYGEPYNPAYAGELKVPLDMIPPRPLDERKIMARRAALELKPNMVVNLGIGVPEGVANVAKEENVLPYVTLTAEPGVIGGVPAGGLSFGASFNTEAIIDQPYQFDFYDGGGLDLACLGMAQCDRHGNVNVSRFGTRLAGCGGFVNISQNAREVVFLGGFTAGGLEVAVEDGRLRIVQEGSQPKFLETVEQITFSGPVAAARGKPVYYVTERCVFRLGREGLILTEVAPGIDIERDILPHMGFRPLIPSRVEPMDPRLFKDELMGLEHLILHIPLADRVQYRASDNTLFVNLAGLKLRSGEEIAAVGRQIERRMETLPSKVYAIANYDGFAIDEELMDAWADLEAALCQRYFLDVTRFTTSAFMRKKLGDELHRRHLAPHIYETQEEAAAFLHRN